MGGCGGGETFIRARWGWEKMRSFPAIAAAQTIYRLIYIISPGIPGINQAAYRRTHTNIHTVSRVSTPLCARAGAFGANTQL